MEWPKLNPESPLAVRKSRSPGPEIKRSSWHAGMPSELAPPPPGSPAAWQDMRRGRSRPLSPSKYASRTLEPIRAVSGSALGPDHGNEVPDEVSSAESGQSLQKPPDTGISMSVTPPDSSEHNPFKFTPTYIVPEKRPRASHRRGHHYKHSSVSLQFFQEPEARAPLAIPVSLAVPTLAEFWQSATSPQFTRLLWCGFRMVVSLAVYCVHTEVHAVAPLAHLLAYETVVSTAAALMSILANFDVWNRSTLRLPFALKRAEALVAFGLAAVLLFIGGDVISHMVQHALQGSHAHHSHHTASHSELNWRVLHFAVVFISVLTIFPSAVSQRSSNPLAMITLIFAVCVLAIPALPAQLGTLLDTALTPTIALAMVTLGWKTAKLFGGMLVMSYGGPDRNSVIAKAVCADQSVESVEDISLWQVHHDLWLASMRVYVSGHNVDEASVRELAEKAVVRAIDVEAEWETTIEILRR